MATLSAASARVTRCARVASRVGVGRVPAAAGAIPSVRVARRSDVAARATSEDAIYRVMSANQEVSVISVVGTSLVSDAVSRHKTAPTATAALGRTMLAATLLGSFKGDDETTQITFKGDGPIGQIIAISDNTGQVKGMVSDPNADPPLRPDGKLNVGGAVGRGVLTVSRAHPEWKAPFNGWHTHHHTHGGRRGVFARERAGKQRDRGRGVAGPRPERPLRGRVHGAGAAFRERRNDRRAGVRFPRCRPPRT